jgi:SAM-dependent methyltransferase
MERRPVSVRQRSSLRKPWHVDYLHMCDLVHDIGNSSNYARGRLLDVGCGNRPYEPLLPGVAEYVGIDVNHLTGRPTISGLAYALPFADSSFDTVFSTQTLEHVEEPHIAITEMSRVLRPGGYLILTAPQSWRLHEKPYDFFRYTRFGLQYLMRHNGLRIVRLLPQGGVWGTVGQIVNNAVHQHVPRRIPVYAAYIIYLISNLLFGLLDRIWVDTDETINYLVIAQKEQV